MIRRLLPLLLLASAVSAGEPETDPASGLIIADGWETVRAHCGGCHSHALVTGQRGDRDTWLAMIRWMQESQNLWQFDPQTENTILDYLATNYPPRRNFRRPPLSQELLPGSESSGPTNR